MWHLAQQRGGTAKSISNSVSREMAFIARKPHFRCRRNPAAFSAGLMLHTRRKPVARADASTAFTNAIPMPRLRNSWWTKIASSAEPELSAAKKRCPTISQAGEHSPTAIDAQNDWTGVFSVSA